MLNRLVSKNSYDILHAHGPKAGLLMGLAALGRGRRNLLVTMHNCHYAQKEQRLENPLLASYYCCCTRLASPLCRQFIAVSRSVKEDLVRLGVSDEKIVVVNNGVSLAGIGEERDSRAVRGEYSIPQESFVIGTVGRLESEKGHATLFQAIERLKHRIPELRVMIIGDGSLMSRLQSEAERLRIDDRVVFCGYQPDVGDLLSALDVFVLPSLTEGFGLGLAEAMARAKPTVASRVGGICDVVEHGETGFLVPPEEPEILSNAIARLWEDSALCHRMGLAGRQRVERLFSITRMTDHTVQLYERLLAEDGETCQHRDESSLRSRTRLT